MDIEDGNPTSTQWFEVTENLAVDILLGTIYISLCIKGIFPMDRKIVVILSTPISISGRRSLVQNMNHTVVQGV